MVYSDQEAYRAARRRHYENNKQQYRDRNEAQKKRNRDFLLAYLRSHPCVDCEEADIRCLQFDHRDPTMKVYNIGRAVSDRVGLDRIKEEIAKCDVRCANCHSKRTSAQFGWYREN